jgi:hypothetical protein
MDVNEMGYEVPQDTAQRQTFITTYMRYLVTASGEGEGMRPYHGSGG